MKNMPVSETKYVFYIHKYTDYSLSKVTTFQHTYYAL